MENIDSLTNPIEYIKNRTSKIIKLIEPNGVMTKYYDAKVEEHTKALDLKEPNDAVKEMAREDTKKYYHKLIDEMNKN